MMSKIYSLFLFILSEIKKIFRTVFFLYLIIFLTSLTLIDQNKVKEAIKVRNLNNLMAGGSLSNLWDIAKNQKFSKTYLAANTRYYEKIREYFPERSEGYGLSGFCAFYEGEPQKAISFYQDAIARNPHFFWYSYNLGLILFKQKQYAQASQLFLRALKAPVEILILVIQNSPQLYGNIVAELPFTKKNFEVHVKNGYKNAATLILESALRAQKYDETLSLSYNFEKQDMIEQKTFLYYAGIALYHKQEFGQAALLLKDYLKLSGNDPEAGYYLGQSLKIMGLTQDAEKILTLYPDPSMGDSLSSSLNALQLQPY